MIAVLLLTLLITDFQQRWVIPDGHGAYGRVLAGEINNNDLADLVIKRSSVTWDPKILFYELQPSNNWELEDSITPDSLFPYFGPSAQWGVGDFDVDGLINLVCSAGWGPPVVGFSIYESPDSFSYPTQEVWRDTVGQAAVSPISAYDIDQDGFPELITNNGDPPNWLWIYESIGDNQYDTVFTSNPDTANIDGPVSTHVFGDFDLDGKTEFVVGGMSAGALGATYWVYESFGNNQYERIIQSYLPTKNIKDCFSVSDADGDGKMEFVVKGFTFPDGKFRVFIFEATGDNTYEIVDTLNFSGFGGSYYGGYSDVGDVDGDGLPEIALEGSFRVYMIEADSNDNFYVFDTLPGNGSGSSVAVYDIDDNGLSEVVISGNNETRIYEYVPQGVEEKQIFTKDHPEISISPNPFSDKLNINFSIEHSAEVTELKIYDATGRLVKEFGHTSNQQFKQVIWVGDDNYGNKVPSGVYFLMFTTERVNETRKLLLIR